MFFFLKFLLLASVKCQPCFYYQLPKLVQGCTHDTSPAAVSAAIMHTCKMMMMMMSTPGNACGNSETNWNTAGRDDVWVCGRLRRSTRMHMLQNIRNTIRKDTGDANMTIWIEDSLTMRHIRLALEDNCTSCTRHPNLTIDGGAHSLTPALQTDFATCCL